MSSGLRGASAFAAALLLAPAVLAAPDGGQAPAAEGGVKTEPGTVLTYYGLRKLELDESVPDEVKLQEWQAFIERTPEQIRYAKEAVERWKNAARLRVIEQVQADDRNPDLGAREKIQRWERVVALYPKSNEARTAAKRIAFWRTQETKRLIGAAEDVERSRAGKVERVQAWRAVAEWVEKGPEARAAEKRIAALQEQLFSEAVSVDKIRRVDNETKLGAWRDVLAGAPTVTQRRQAERRVFELEAELKTEKKDKPGG